MNNASALGLSVLQKVNIIMVSKPNDQIVGQPTTETMDCMTKPEYMAQMVMPVKTSALVGLQGSFALVLDNNSWTTRTIELSLSRQRQQPTAPTNPWWLTLTLSLIPYHWKSELQKMLGKVFDL